MLSELLYLGFSEKEAKIYELLTTGEALCASTIAKRTDIKRASIYEVLQGLQKKQMISCFKKHGHMYFHIDSPERIIHQYKAKLELASSIVTQIKQKKKRQEVVLELHKDTQGFKELYKEILLSGEKEFLAWSNFESFDQIIDAAEEQKLTRERVENGTRPRLIMVRNSVSEKFQKEDKKWSRDTELIDGDNNFSSTLVMSQDTLYFFDDTPDVIAIKLVHSGFSTMMREIFESYWKTLKKRK